jgi:hypothetical protein
LVPESNFEIALSFEVSGGVRAARDANRGVPELACLRPGSRVRRRLQTTQNDWLPPRTIWLQPECSVRDPSQARAVEMTGPAIESLLWTFLTLYIILLIGHCISAQICLAFHSRSPSVAVPRARRIADKSRLWPDGQPRAAVLTWAQTIHKGKTILG